MRVDRGNGEKENGRLTRLEILLVKRLVTRIPKEAETAQN